MRNQPAFLAASLLLTASTFTAAAAGENPPVAGSPGTVTVELASGRSFTGFVDARTSQTQLWLRFGSGSTRVLRPIAWDRVVAAYHGDVEITPAQLRQMASDGDSAKEPAVPPADPPAARFLAAPRAEQARELLQMSTKVTNVLVSATLSNWNNDPADDGLLLNLLPVDAGGQMVRAGGTVEMKLLLPRHASPRIRHQPAAVIAQQWHLSFTPSDFTASGLVLKLPFTTFDPARDEEFESQGKLEVRISFPGHGVFERERDGVRVRPYAPTDDLIRRSRRF